MNDQQIKELRDRSEDDDMLWCVCTIALEGPISSFEERFGGGGFRLTRKSKLFLESMTQEEARAVCAEYIE